MNYRYTNDSQEAAKVLVALGLLAFAFVLLALVSADGAPENEGEDNDVWIVDLDDDGPRRPAARPPAPRPPSRPSPPSRTSNGGR